MYQQLANIYCQLNSNHLSTNSRFNWSYNVDKNLFYFIPPGIKMMFDHNNTRFCILCKNLDNTTNNFRFIEYIKQYLIRTSCSIHTYRKLKIFLKICSR